MWGIFFGEFQCLPVNDCSAVSCDSGVLTIGSESTSFYSAIWNQSPFVVLFFHSCTVNIEPVMFYLQPAEIYFCSAGQIGRAHVLLLRYLEPILLSFTIICTLVKISNMSPKSIIQWYILH